MKRDELVGVCHDEVILGTLDPRKAFLPQTTVPPLKLFRH